MFKLVQQNFEEDVKEGYVKDREIKMFINPDVCEGCGDCAEKSNCVAVKPLSISMELKDKLIKVFVIRIILVKKDFVQVS